MATKAGKAALADAKIPFNEVQQAYAGYVYGDSTCGQRAVYQLGLTGIPVFNVNNNCSTGSSALMLGAPGGRGRHRRVRARRRLRADGEAGALGGEVDRSREPARQVRQRDERGAGLQPGAARRADVRRRRPRVPLEVRHEARDVRARSPRRRASTRRRTRTRCSRRCSRVEEILASPEVFDPLTRYQCCPPTCGAAAAVLCSDEFAKKHGISQAGVHRGARR